VWISSTSCLDHFFLWFLEYFHLIFYPRVWRSFFFDSFRAFGCYDESYHLSPTLEWIYGSSPFNFMDFSLFPPNLGFLVHPKSEGNSLDLWKTSFRNLFLVLRWPLCLSFIQFGALLLKNQIWEERGGFWNKIAFSRDLLPDNVRRDLNKVWPSVLSSRNPKSDNVQLGLLAQHSFTVLAISF
jgi:hypothetical protein